MIKSLVKEIIKKTSIIIEILEIQRSNLSIKCSEENLTNVVEIFELEFKCFQKRGYFCRCEKLTFFHKEDELKIILTKK